MSRCMEYYVNKNRSEMFPFSYCSLFVSTSQPYRPLAYSIFLVLWWVQEAVKQAELLLIRICQFIPDFRIYSNYLSHIKSECSFIYICCWEKVVNARGHSQQAETTPRLFVTVRGSCRSSCCGLGSVPHQPCSAPQMSFTDDTQVQGFPLGSNGSVVTCTATKSSQSDKMQHSLCKLILLR